MQVPTHGQQWQSLTRPMQVPTHGQWWSNLSTQLSHTAQCEQRGGR